MLLSRIVEASRGVTETSSRSRKVEILRGALAALGPEELEIGVAYLAGDVRQSKLGVGYASVASVNPEPARGPSLTLSAVDESFERMAGRSGSGSNRERLRLLRDLLASATREEQAFLKRLIVGELRQGALEGVLVEAVAKAASVPPEALRRAVMLSGSLRTAARAALAEGERGLAAFKIELFRPLSPMLAQTTESSRDAFSTVGTVALEYKLDGARIQVHKAGADVRVWSRRLNDVTDRVPELVEVVRALPARSIVLDGEAIALRADGRPHSFQDTMSRFGRRTDVATARAARPLSAAFFDVLHVDGSDLVALPALERSAALARSVPEGLRVERIVPNDVEEARAFYDEALERGHEGLMIKSLESLYEAGRRGAGWLKLKPAHTLDLVVLAAEWGSGRRQGRLSNLHLGARAPETGAFVMLGKTFKGMTDEMLEWQTRRLLDLAVERDAYIVYVRPELVVEVAFDGVQSSSQYPGGVALRFARVRRYRTDKRPADADTLETVRAFRAATS